jgi:hypothetical protein
MRKANILYLFVVLMLFAVSSLARASAQTPQHTEDGLAAAATSLPFQGVLRNADGPITGVCDLKFSLYDTAQSGVKIGSDIFRLNATLSAGVYTTALDFGDVYGAAERWLEIGVRCPAGQGAYVVLAPRQEVGWVPRAQVAARVLNLTSAPGDFTANGVLRSTRNDPQDGVAGALELHNGANGNRWHMAISRVDDALLLGMVPAGQTWTHAATFDRNGNLILVHDLYLNGVVSSSLTVNGVLRSARGMPEDTSSGLLELQNTLTNNKWHITSNRDTDDLQFWFAENGDLWSHAATLERDGDLTTNKRMHVVGDSLNFMNAPAAILWQEGGAAIGHALNSGEYSASAQPGDLVMRADDGRRILLGRGAAAANFPAALTVAASGQVSIPDLQTGGVVEANLQQPAELTAETIARFQPGDVLCWDVAAEILVRCQQPASPLVVAIANVQGKPLIAGVEPVRVCGVVQPGDLLVASATPGCAQAWESATDGDVPPGVVIAKALAASSGGEHLVKAMILAR